MEETSGERLERLPAFDGKFKLFVIWWIHFRAFATVCKFVEALKPKDEAHMPATEETLILSRILHTGVCHSTAVLRVEMQNSNVRVFFGMARHDLTTVAVLEQQMSSSKQTTLSSSAAKLSWRHCPPDCHQRSAQRLATN
jgi:hypothetical protein